MFLALIFLLFQNGVLSTDTLFLHKCLNFKQGPPAPVTHVKNAHFEIRLTGKEQHIDCNDPKVIHFPVEDILSETTTRQSSSEELRPIQVSNSKPPQAYFTEDGHFHDGVHFYPRSLYCIHSLTNRNMELHTCPPICESSTSSTELCIPKCCAVNEVVSFWERKCRKLEAHEPHWTPRLISEESYENLHFHRENLPCKEKQLRVWSFSDVKRVHENESEINEKASLKLVAREGKLKLTYLDRKDRKWKEYSQSQYCFDGFVNENGLERSPEYKDDPNDVIVHYCPPRRLPSAKRSTWVTRIYISFQIVAEIFLLLIVVIYLMLLDKQTLHGLTILCYTGCLLCSYLSYTVAHIISTYPRPSNGIRRGAFCMAVALLTHYFNLATYFWLTVLNFDLWVTLRSIRPIPIHSRRLSTFAWYSGLAWGIPLLLVASFYVLDEVYRDPETEVVVPDYAVWSCSVATWSRGEYVYAPLAIILFFNGVLVLATFKILCEARRKKETTLKDSCSNINAYSMKVFLKLFCITGAVWTVRLVSWHYNSYIKPWYIVVLDLSLHFQTVVMFILFCWNDRTLDQMMEKYPKSRKLLQPIKNFKPFRKGRIDRDDSTGTMTSNMSGNELIEIKL